MALEATRTTLHYFSIICAPTAVNDSFYWRKSLPSLDLEKIKLVQLLFLDTRNILTAISLLYCTIFIHVTKEKNPEDSNTQQHTSELNAKLLINSTRKITTA